MPLYEYECQQCQRHTEKRQKFSDVEITICPHCGGPLKRVITAPAIAFKGGGWYADGYGNAKPKSSETTSSGDSKSSDAPKDAGAKPSSGDTPASTPTTPTTTPSPPPSTGPAAPTKS